MSLFYGHEKARQNLRFSGLFTMVGVARIELATPTMSTQSFRVIPAAFGHFDDRRKRNGLGTDRLFALISRKSHANREAAA